MKMIRRKNIATYLTAFLLVAAPVIAFSAEHPSLVMTKSGVEKIRLQLGSVPLFDASVEAIKKEVDAEIVLGIDTPIPRDFSGGYTHERHKKNFFVMKNAGDLFQILQDEKYAIYVRDMLFQYEAMYKDLPLHPQERSYARGKLFWQCLNDANWLVFAAQAYDAIYEWLSEEERQLLEDNLFRPFADHISVDNPQFFNRVHNHSTWGAAAVGMIGLVMRDEELIKRALYGIEGANVFAESTDDDGGFIRVEGQKVGFFANLDEPFSPDGYYTEGPYYQRYAMYPFLIFAQGLNNVKPELRVFEHKDGVLLKAVYALLNLTDADGEFFPLNDAQKGMSYYSRELVTAVDIAYHVGGQDPKLLSIAQMQDRVILDDTGLSVALAVRDGKAEPFEKDSINLSDGPDGKQGGVAILRHGNEDLALVFKYAAQGLSHGHYDKLSFSLYEKGDEVIQDYGLVRFVNIEQKGGGNYLPENASWAKQTIAHNTVTQDEISHFDGDYVTGSQFHSDLLFFDASDESVKVASAIESNAYPETAIRRTMAIIKDEGFEKPFVLDILKLTSGKKHQYDLPFYYTGQILKTSFEYDVPTTLEPLGDSNGYQHIYLEGRGATAAGTAKLSWMDNNRFYSLSTSAKNSDELLLTRIGANDPDFNLRRDPAFIIRRSGAGNTVFVSTIESHGSYDPVSEIAISSKSSIADLRILHDEDDYTAIAIEDIENRVSLFISSNADIQASTVHYLDVGGKTYSWSGPYHYTDL